MLVKNCTILQKRCVMEKEIIRFDKNDLPIKLYRLNMRQDGNYLGMHSHVAVEVVEVKSGELQCHINNEVVQLCSGEIIFINSNTGHRLLSENAEISYMQIDLNFFTENADNNEFSRLCEFVAQSKAKSHLLFHKNPEIKEILDKIHGRYYENQESSRWYLKAYIYELIAFMYSQSFIVPPTMSVKQIEKIKWIVGYIDANFRSPITLEEICAAVGYNKYGICHCFKSVTGATVFDYINFLRVRLAVEKLKQKENSILEIAADSGFSSPTYFNRVFKRFFGCSPSVYRKLLVI